MGGGDTNKSVIFWGTKNHLVSGKVCWASHLGGRDCINIFFRSVMPMFKEESCPMIQDIVEKHVPPSIVYFHGDVHDKFVLTENYKYFEIRMNKQGTPITEEFIVSH